jgi:hypothetical protein
MYSQPVLSTLQGKFIPTDPRGRAECINWVMWMQGAAPYIGGEQNQHSCTRIFHATSIFIPVFFLDQNHTAMRM